MIVAAFDFDGTITKRDTFAGFLFFSFGYLKVFKGTVILLKVLLFNKLGIVSNQKAKEQVFSYFFKGMSIRQFEGLCKDYSGEIEKIVRPDAIKAIQWHQKNEHRVMIITASVYNWIKPWAEAKGIMEVIATQIEISNGILSGEFSSKNCRGQEKVERLQAVIPEIKKCELYVYGDSDGDKELLEIATKPFYRNFGEFHAS